MAFIITIWVLIALATLGLIFALVLLQSCLKKENNNGNVDRTKQVVTKCMAVVTMVITSFWWISLMIFQIVTKGIHMNHDQFIVMLLTVTLIFIIVYLSIYLTHTVIEKTYHVSIRGNSVFTFMKCTTLITSIIYAVLVNYGVQLILILQK